MTASELGRLAENSRRVARNALRTIERDTEEATGRMRELLMKAWFRPLVVGLGLWLGIFGGSWATMRWLSRSIQNRIETLAMANGRIEQARETLAELEADTWGDRAPRDRGGAVRGAAIRHTGRSRLGGARSARREAVERVRELYERVGTAVDGGLEEVVRAVRDGTAAALRARRSLAAARRSLARARRAAKQGERRPCGSASSGRAGRTKPCRCESNGSTGR